MERDTVEIPVMSMEEMVFDQPASDVDDDQAVPQAVEDES
jgi:hypothetical protein